MRKQKLDRNLLWRKGKSRAQKLSNWKHENKVSQWPLFDAIAIASQDVTFSNKVFQVFNQYSIHTFLDAMIELIRSCLLLCDVPNEMSETRMY